MKILSIVALPRYLTAENEKGSIIALAVVEVYDETETRKVFIKEDTTEISLIR